MIEVKPTQYYIDCDFIIAEYSPEYIRENNLKNTRCMHYGLNDKTSECTSGLWRDGSISNAIHDLKLGYYSKLKVIHNHEVILEIDKNTPKELYIREIFRRASKCI